VREFARLQEQNSTVRPEPVEGLSFTTEGEDQSRASTSSARTDVEDAEAGMAEMSKRFHEEGSEIYVPTED
jgi:hypothetical protein